ncbi:PDZ and LIM domain protein 7 isoform X3 [Strix uralensis]|uniref:PDZ and LIM domain protein 7 isoform X3 n=1 Tax=Strix uralensis TaxID=36305 RepID=UPI003DA3F732
MERPVKDGILYVQHCKFGKRSWRKMRAQLFAASPSGVARMEKFDVRDDGTVLEKTSLRRCARRVIRLSDCVSVGPAGTESCPKATAAFYLNTTEKSYVLAAEQRDEWIAQLCQLAFQGAKETAESSARPQPSPAVPMEENSLYSSWQDLTEFPVLVVRTDAATRCGLHGHYLLSALPQSLTLKDAQSRQPLLTWPYPFLRKFGQDQTVFSFEAGRRSDSEMGDMESYKVMLNGPAPWGFRLQGGKDFSMPLSISRLTPGGKAAQAGVGVGDWVLYIDGESTSSMTHIEAQNRIRACGDRLCLSLSRAQNHLGKTQKVSVLDPSPGATMKTEPGMAPRTPTTTPGPASRPPWAVDPSFAERYAPDKTSTVVSKHSQPATPTPMQNRSSIVQAAQQAPEGPGRTPLCYKCNKVIRGRYLVALGHYYHPEEFTCCQCRKVLDEGGFFEEKGSIFCPKCYDTRYAPSCAKCKKKITGEVMHALKMTWHVQCFTCAACKTPIRNRAFYMEEGQPYCERDYEKMFGTKCRGCDFKIDAGDRFLEALGFSWHDTCFVCAICQTNLEGKTFYSKKDKPLCKSHAFSHV